MGRAAAIFTNKTLRQPVRFVLLKQIAARLFVIPKLKIPNFGPKTMKLTLVRAQNPPFLVQKHPSHSVFCTFSPKNKDFSCVPGA